MAEATNKAIVGNIQRNLEEKKRGLAKGISKSTMGPENDEKKGNG